MLLLLAYADYRQDAGRRYLPRVSVPVDRLGRAGWWQRTTVHAERPAFVQPPLQALGRLKAWGDREGIASKMMVHLQSSVIDGDVTHPMVHRLAQPGPHRDDVHDSACIVQRAGMCVLNEYIT